MERREKERRERSCMCREAETKMGIWMYVGVETGQRVSDARNRTGCEPELHDALDLPTLHRASVVKLVPCRTWRSTAFVGRHARGRRGAVDFQPHERGDGGWLQR